jgi:hypothetical protein
MKFSASALSIALMFSFFLLAGCETLHLPNLTHHDEVPPEVKAQPMLIATPPPQGDPAGWPRLGDVPFKPKDFSPQPVYDHYMDELEFHRDEAEDAKQKAQEDDPVPEIGATQNERLFPPHLPQHPKE